MIRKLGKTDIDRVADIWVKTNIQAHAFIPAQYWLGYFDMVKELLLQAEVYVCESDDIIQGFIGLNGDYIEGIFVADDMQGNGIGKLLLDYVKCKKEMLCLSVYRKNVRAIRFYQREGFEIQGENRDEGTGEREYRMVWEGVAGE